MATHQVVGDNLSPFMKRVLVPFWVIRILVMCLLAADYGVVLGVRAAHPDDYDDYTSEGDRRAALAILVVSLLIILLCLALDIVCIVKRAHRTLSPRFFLISNVIQTTVWTVLFVLTLFRFNGFSILIAFIVFLCFIGVLIYASIIYHRARMGTLRGTYVPAIHVQTVYVEKAGGGAGAPLDPGAGYYAPYAQQQQQQQQPPPHYDPEAQRYADPRGLHGQTPDLFEASGRLA